MTAQARGFTLIEMSIVLVIIGLIVGGTMVGQTLIQASQMRALMTQVERYKTAALTFRDKYYALPGDIANATAFWPADPSCGTGGSAGVRPYMATPNGKTCNGDGNGIIEGNYDVEEVLFWQHLNLAGLIQDGPFTGTCAYAGANCSSDSETYNLLNAPTYPIHPGAGIIRMLNPDIRFPNTSYFNYFVPQGGQHVFYLNGWSGTDGSGNTIVNGYGAPALTPGELFALDTKYDDGLPASGVITGGYAEINGGGTTLTANACYNGSVSPPAYYSSSSSAYNTLRCAPMFKAGF
jgi:prepilin-type N-terminal cleavage/methylation domain-containing protein